MRDDHDRAAVTPEVPFEPRDGVEVDVVGRLVEEQKVGVLRQDDPEPQATALAPRERRHRAAHVLLGEPELLSQDGDLALELVAAREVVAVHHVREVVQGLLVARGRVVLRLRERRAERNHVGEAREEGGQDVPFGAELVRLPVVAERGLSTDDRRALVGLDLSGDDPQERRLAGAVGRDEGRALAEREAEGDVLKQRVAGVPEAEVGDLEHGHGAGGFSRRTGAGRTGRRPP